MMDFVRKYRNLTILPLPQVSDIKIRDLMAEIEMLFEEDFKLKTIEFGCEIEKNVLNLNADKEQVEQVLINLIKNAIWAVTNSEVKLIDVRIALNKAKRIQIEVSDSGFGLNDELLDKIFIPFFTTRTEGSGIGLSLARQIMLMHGGSISAHSNEGNGATFVLVF
jgi:signal transduction histidine kinase